MRIIRKHLSILFLLCVYCIAPRASLAASLKFKVVPDVIRPGKYYDIKIESAQNSVASVTLLDAVGALRYDIFDEYPLVSGENSLQWDGRRREDFSVIEAGEYQLRVSLQDGTSIDSELRIGAPYPMLTHIQQSDSVVGDFVKISYTASESGTLSVELVNPGDPSRALLTSSPIAAGPGVYQWDGQVEGQHAAPGSYALVMMLTAANGSASIAEHVYIEILSDEPEPTPEPEAAALPAEDAPDPTAEPAPEPTPFVPSISPPYSDVEDGSFWSMTPGELDDAAIWEIMMQPITVYDDGKIKGNGHAYMMENPDGTGNKVAQIHGLSQGLHILSEVNEHGYVLAEMFPNYDREFYPKTDEEKATVFDIKRGYVKASNLKTVEVMTDMALLIDKLTQRMYLFKDGVRVTEFLISTGTFTGDDYLFETPPGEFITVSHTGQLRDGNMISDMAIRINGGILVHEVPHKENKDGTYNYSSFEGYLGTKQSHGCIRVQRKKTPEGYNQRWIWENFKKGAPYKVIIWDDRGRVDQPSTWQENPQ